MDRGAGGSLPRLRGSVRSCWRPGIVRVRGQGAARLWLPYVEGDKHKAAATEEGRHHLAEGPSAAAVAATRHNARGPRHGWSKGVFVATLLPGAAKVRGWRLAHRKMKRRISPGVRARGRSVKKNGPALLERCGGAATRDAFGGRHRSRGLPAASCTPTLVTGIARLRFPTTPREEKEEMHHCRTAPRSRAWARLGPASRGEKLASGSWLYTLATQPPAEKALLEDDGPRARVMGPIST